MIKQTLVTAALAVALMGSAFASQYDKQGFVTQLDDGRLWIFKDGSPELADMQKNGVPEKASIRIGAGPDGLTLEAPDDTTIQAYLDAPVGARPGFVTVVDDGRLWVFKDGSPALADYQKNGVPEKASIRIGVGPEGMTLEAPDDTTIQAYLDAGTISAATTANNTSTAPATNDAGAGAATPASSPDAPVSGSK